MNDHSALATQALLKAIYLADGVANLSEDLAIAEADLHNFAVGGSAIPEAVFLLLVDYILEDQHAANFRPSDFKAAR